MSKLVHCVCIMRTLYLLSWSSSNRIEFISYLLYAWSQCQLTNINCWQIISLKSIPNYKLISIKAFKPQLKDRHFFFFFDELNDKWILSFRNQIKSIDAFWTEYYLLVYLVLIENIRKIRYKKINCHSNQVECHFIQCFCITIIYCIYLSTVHLQNI